MLFGDLNVKEILKRENTHVHIADSLCHTVKTNNTEATILQFKKQNWNVIYIIYEVIKL